MTANKVYFPAFIGGSIIGSQMTIQNTTGSSITCNSDNGVYYTFEGRDFQILDLAGVTIPAGETVVVPSNLRIPFKPNGDIKVMINTAGLAGTVCKVLISWEV